MLLKFDIYLLTKFAIDHFLYNTKYSLEDFIENHSEISQELIIPFTL